MNNSNALAEIQSKYPNCNLLLPAATSVQINPFYKCSVMEVPLMVRMEQERAVCSWMPLSTASMKNQERE